jgi:hypothetical protein
MVHTVGTRVTSFEVSVNDKTVYPEFISEYKLEPYNQAEQRRIPVESYLDNTVQMDKKLVVKEELQFDGKRLLLFTMPGLINGNALTTIKFKFNIGATLDIFEALASKAQLAISNILDRANSANYSK